MAAVVKVNIYNDAVEMTIHINVLQSVVGSTQPKVMFYFVHGK